MTQLVDGERVRLRIDERIARLRLSLPFSFRLHDDDYSRTEYGTNRLLFQKKNWQVLDILQVSVHTLMLMTTGDERSAS